MEYAIGIDIGGTNTDIGLVNEKGQCVARKNLPTAQYKEVEKYVDDIADAIRHLLSENDVNDIAGIGIGAPNGNYYTGTIDFAPNLPFKGRIFLKDMIQQRLNTKVVLSNDANAAAYGEKITLTGGSMGGYQALGVAALAAKAGYEIEQASVSVPAFCNTSGYKKEGRINNIFGIGYEANMDYFDGVFFAEYIECKTAFTKVGLGDYTCPPSGVIAAYNALKCDKSMNLHQNSQHDYWSDANPIYTFSEYAETE